MAERVSDALEQGNQKRKWKRHCWSTIVVFVVYRHAFSENKTRMVCWTSNFAAFISRVRVANATKRSRQDVLAVCCIWLHIISKCRAFWKKDFFIQKKIKERTWKIQDAHTEIETLKASSAARLTTRGRQGYRRVDATLEAWLLK